jgi:ribosomal protein L10
MTNSIIHQPTAPVVSGNGDAHELTQLAQLFVQSGFFADVKDVAQAAIKILAGRELGIGPFEAMSQIHVIKGKVAMSAGLMAARIKRSGRYDYRVLQLSDTIAELEFTDRGKAIGTSRFTTEDAKAAGLASNDMYRKYARNMLFARAISNGVRWHMPDLFGGSMYTPEELTTATVVEDVPAIEAAPVVETVETTTLVGVVRTVETALRGSTIWWKGEMITDDGEVVMMVARNGAGEWVDGAHDMRCACQCIPARHPTIPWEVTGAELAPLPIADESDAAAGTTADTTAMETEGPF